jgi:hypothetical protein
MRALTPPATMSRSRTAEYVALYRALETIEVARDPLFRRAAELRAFRSGAWVTSFSQIVRERGSPAVWRFHARHRQSSPPRAREEDRVLLAPIGLDFAALGIELPHAEEELHVDGFADPPGTA